MFNKTSCDLNLNVNPSPIPSITQVSVHDPIQETARSVLGQTVICPPLVKPATRTLSRQTQSRSLSILNSDTFSFSVKIPAIDVGEISYLQRIQALERKKFEKILNVLLKESGQDALAALLISKKGDPWNEIKKLSSPLLMEQLVSLYELCLLKDERCTKGIINFCLGFANKDKKTFKDRKVMENNQFLGKLIFVVNRDITKIAEIISKTDRDSVIGAIERVFEVELKLAQEEFATQKNTYLKNSAIKDSQLMVSTRLPLKIAELLITDNGWINVGIIQIIEQQFIHPFGPHLPYEMQMKSALTALSKSAKLRNVFFKIAKPFNATMPSNHLIRICLNLTPRSEIDDFHAKKTALVALLSHLRQGKVGSCFATHLCIEQMSSNLTLCLQDFSELLKSSKLTRIVEGDSQDFPFAMHVNLDLKEQAIEIDRFGNAIDKQGFPYSPLDLPGFKSACETLGIQNIKMILSILLPRFFTREDLRKTKCISIKNLLKKVILYASTRQLHLEEPANNLLERGLLAYSGQTQNILLRVWENAVGGMAEASTMGTNKKALIRSIIVPLSYKLSQIEPVDSEYHKELTSHVLKQLHKRIQLRYSPGIQRLGKLSSKDGFILYDRTDANLSWDSVLIDNSSAFQGFVEDVVEKADLLLNSNAPQKNRNYEERRLKLFQYIQSDHFLIAAIKICHPNNRAICDPLNTMHECERIPWLYSFGKNSREVRRIYFEQPFTKSDTAIIPQDSTELLAGIIDTVKKLSPEKKIGYINNSGALTPLIVVGTHASSLMLGHPSMIRTWSNSENTENWINEQILVPGIALSNAQIEPETRLKLMSYLTAKVVSKEKMIDFEKEAHLIPQAISIKEFRSLILNLVDKLKVGDKTSLKLTASKIDEYLCSKALPEKERLALSERAIHFADTNWGRSIHNVHFCFIVNPGTGVLEMWKILEDGSKLKAMNQDKWIKGRIWKYAI